MTLNSQSEIPNPKSEIRKGITWALVILVVAGTIWLGWSAARAATQARLALADLRRLEALADNPSPAALPALREELAALEAHLTAARAAARPFLWLAPGLGWLPEVGPTVRAGPALLEMAIELAGGGRQALEALAPVTGLLGEGGEGDLLAQAVPALAAAAPELAAAEVRLVRAGELRTAVGESLHPKLASQLERLDRILPLARAGLQAAQVAPALLAADGPRTYLILAQNNHELRATGGFISGVGFVRLEGGRITDLKLADSYAVDNFQQPHPAPPQALREQMGIQLLLLRDSNWFPDFPTAAQVARALYEQDQGVATDGALALDLEAVRLLVAALGPLEVPGMDGQVTGANVISRMKEAWESPATSEGTVAEAASSDWWRKRKDFMAELMVAALGKLQGNALGQHPEPVEGPAPSLPKGGQGLNAAALASALLEMLDGRHLQIAVDDPAVAALLAERGWDGALRPPPDGDFLAVVDSNVGYNKANAAVQQEVTYRVEPKAGQPEATLTLTYAHIAPALPADQPCDRTPRYGDSYDDLIHRCFWDYLRVYAPGGSELLASEGLDRVTSESGERNTTVFAGAFVLRPGETHVVVLRYRLPPHLAGERYRLTVRHQAGTLAPPLQVEVGGCRWETDLGRDRVFECEKAADGSG